MRKTGILFIITLSLCLIHPGSSPAGDGWKEVINKNGISVFVRPVRDSGIDEFRAVAIIETEIDVLKEVMKDIPAQPQWYADCSYARVVKEAGNRELIFYAVYKAPWPVTDRDIVIETVIELDPGNRWFTIHMKAADTQLVPIKSDRVRIRKMKGEWTFRKTGKRSVKVVYNLIVDPGGSLPRWLANRTSRESPYMTLLNLRKMVKLSKYQSKKKSDKKK